MTTQTAQTPAFHLARHFAAIRALVIVVLVAALTAGFLAQVWRAPTSADADAVACRAGDVAKCA